MFLDGGEPTVSRYCPGVIPSTFLKERIKFCELLYLSLAAISFTGISVSRSQVLAILNRYMVRYSLKAYPVSFRKMLLI